MTRRWARASWTVRWGGLGLAVVILGVLVASRWWWVYWYGAGPYRSTATLARGVVDIEWLPPVRRRPDTMFAGTPGWSVRAVRQRPIPGMSWRPDFNYRSWAGTCIVTIPLWIPAALALTPASWAWTKRSRRSQRQAKGLCPICGYNVAGIAAGVCPECGTAHAAR